MDEANKALEFLLENLELLSEKPCSLPCKLYGTLLQFSLPKLEIQDQERRDSEGAYATTIRCLCNIRRQHLITSLKGLVHVFLFGWLAAKHRSSFLSSNERAHVVALCEDIRVIRSIFTRSHEARIENQQLKFLNHEARYWTCMALDATDNFLLGIYFSPLSSELALFRDYFNSLRRALSRMYFSDPSYCPIQVVTEGDSSSHASNRAISEGELMVGLEKVTNEILGRLFSHDKQREVISIVGMAGIGKTALAQNLYNNQDVASNFSFIAWTTVSQTFQKKNILCDLLDNIVDRHTLSTMHEGDLADKLRKHLYGKKYLIFIDDVWHDEVWDELEICFPDNNNRSRILMITQIKEVANLCKSPVNLSLLGQVESWTLFCHKAFRRKRCPPMLEVVAREIVKRCGGLPLAIVVIARLLAKKKMTVTSWSQFAESMDAHHDDQEALDQFMGTLALSYEHLPFRLKLCFLYFAIFPEDYAIPIKRLILSWIAEGYVEKVENKSLEEVARSYLMDLIDRNLVIVSKKRSNGEVKACSVHDMLRDLCKKIMEKESFRVLHLYEWVHDNRSLTLKCWTPDPFGHVICGHSHCSCGAFHEGTCAPYMRILLLSGTILSLYRLLRVLDLDDVIFPIFPTLTLQLTHLKYLALHVQRVGRRKLQIDSLWNLETFILRYGGETDLILQQGIWKMAKLRHVYVYPSFEIEMPWSCFFNYLVLHDMHTMTTLKCSSRIQDVLARIPNLRKLGIYLNEKDSFFLPDFSGLKHLETLEINWFTTLYNKVPVGIPDPRTFPPNVKKLTLTTGYLDWKDMKIIGLLPNLEVLKVRYNCFSGPVWETCDGGFCNLKFLELCDLDIKQWISSGCDHFPSLQFLVEIQKLQLEMGASDQLQLFTGDNAIGYHDLETAMSSQIELTHVISCSLFLSC
ncbi:hypothetical protein HAX54_024801 [Datura stramonium]|uniref:NB-ARC domain-containing protein n=1 Tax=Datura stramonium TaxID=4076 RepID=A0ABS8S6M0_DATST|nr:hypothetical protein [Datura stramonium]